MCIHENIFHLLYATLTQRRKLGKICLIRFLLTFSEISKSFLSCPTRHSLFNDKFRAHNVLLHQNGLPYRVECMKCQTQQLRDYANKILGSSQVTIFEVINDDFKNNLIFITLFTGPIPNKSFQYTDYIIQNEVYN